MSGDTTHLSISDMILAVAARQGATLVFPSEVSAGFWREEVLRCTAMRAVRADRFVSWDTFKESAFSSDEARVPANALYRTMFVATLLDENARKPFLRRIIDPRFAANSFAFLRSIRTVLGGLDRYVERRRAHRALDAAAGRYDRELDADLESILVRYVSYLSRFGLFEPAWRSRVTPLLRNPVHLFFPEVLEDYREYASLLEPLQEFVVHRLPSEQPGSSRAADGGRPASGTCVIEFDNALHEVRSTLDQIESLLEHGVPAERIVVTLVDESGYRPILESEAELRAIPLSFRSGRSLSEYEAARFFTTMQRCVADGFSLESLKSLLLNRSLPWKRADLALALIRFGHSWNVMPATSRDSDPWTHALRAAGADELFEYYRSLRRSMAEAIESSNFRELRNRLYAFYSRHLDTAAWDPEQLPVFQAAMDVLSGTISTAEVLVSGPMAGSGGTISPYHLFVESLRDKTYVPRSSAPGIGVYAYRVAGGIVPDHHMVLGFSHESSRVTISRFPYLRDDQKSAIGLADADLTEPFASLYLQSGATVRFSYARETRGGPRLASELFVRNSAVLPAATGRSDRSTGAGGFGEQPRRLSRELRAWRLEHSASIPASIYPVQKEGYFRARGTGLADRQPDYAHRVIDDPRQRKRISDHQLSDYAPGYLSLSSDHLERFVVCPFSYLLRRGLRLLEEPYELDFSGAQSIGSLYHSAIERTYREIRETDQRYIAAHIDRYEEIARVAVERVFRDSMATRVPHDREQSSEASDAASTTRDFLDIPEPVIRPLVPPLLAATRERALRYVGALLRVDCDDEDGNEIVAAEDWYNLRLDDDRILLFGRVDRVTRNPVTGAARLVDYKRRNTPTNSEIRALLLPREQWEGTTVSLQIPLYAALAANRRAGLERAGYYAIEHGTYRVVYDGTSARGKITADEIEALEGAVLALAKEVGAAVLRGDYRYGSLGGRCNGCDYRAVCRSRYSVRLT